MCATTASGFGRSSRTSAASKRAPRPIRVPARKLRARAFAGSAADAFSLLERFAKKLSEFPDNTRRAVIELAKDWRTDRMLRRLEAMLAVADRGSTLIITGAGDVLEPEFGIAAIGSGGAYAQSAARALLEHTDLGPEAIVRESLGIAADLCIYTNRSILIETLA